MGTYKLQNRNEQKSNFKCKIIMPLGEFIKGIFAGKTGDLVKKVGDTIDNLTLSKEEKEQFKINTLIAINHMKKKWQRLTLNNLSLKLRICPMLVIGKFKLQIAIKHHY